MLIVLMHSRPYNGYAFATERSSNYGFDCILDHAFSVYAFIVVVRISAASLNVNDDVSYLVFAFFHVSMKFIEGLDGNVHLLNVV